jgi:hypothetical protein
MDILHRNVRILITAFFIRYKDNKGLSPYVGQPFLSLLVFSLFVAEARLDLHLISSCLFLLIPAFYLRFDEFNLMRIL